jgi:isoaspartyl peptidase/L-asparaginase-like protein (Ntn-hydrolase superfamily)
MMHLMLVGVLLEGHATDAVEAAVVALEDNDAFDAGNCFYLRTFYR